MANLLGAMIRGAAGKGLVDMTQRWDREEEMARAEDRRRQEREEDRKFREEQARLDREARSGGSRRSSSGGSDGEGGGGDYRVAEVMKRFRVSDAEARAMVKASEEGKNLFEREALSTEQIDDGDGRMRSVTSKTMQPDTQRWAELNAAIADAMIRGPSMARSNYDQLAKGMQVEAATARTDAAERGFMTPERAAELNASADGKYPGGKPKQLLDAETRAEDALADQRLREKPSVSPDERERKLTSEERRRAIASYTSELGRLEGERKNVSKADRAALEDRIRFLRTELDALRRSGASDAPAPAAPASAPAVRRYDKNGNLIKG